jgi:hypothetical protein
MALRRSTAARGCGGHRASPAGSRALLLILLLATTPVLAEASPPGPESFQARIDEAGRALENDLGLRSHEPQQRQELSEFVAGNMLFVLLHELGHALVAEMALPVLGREEDAADTFAITTMIRMGTAFSHRVLVEATKGWFISDRRDRDGGEKLAYYDAHGLDRQRAYQIVCLMVGSDSEMFKDLADETALPESRRQSCAADYSNASWSWETALKPHLRTAGQPKTVIRVSYEVGKDKLEMFARFFRSIRLLETIAAKAADHYRWPRPLAVEMKSCGVPSAQWSFRSATITLCYEMAAELAHLYRDYGADWERSISAQ